ncbi:Uncharacterized protein APZ42_031969 [Daphnia magna]|uniref:Secreted protein n=1 Tax=Daphnia magna TaxID=35525 RepID=A0A164MEQ7_9CRUS|nr:Uncharacterized protein APZ42_031969 [Daphnia magna]
MMTRPLLFFTVSGACGFSFSSERLWLTEACLVLPIRVKGIIIRGVCDKDEFPMHFTKHDQYCTNVSPGCGE